MAARNQKVDFATVAGVLVAGGAILGGLVLEGGKISDLAQLTAALIVLGGTLGAVMVATPPRVLRGAIRRLAGLVRDPGHSISQQMEEILEYSAKARRTGLVSLEETIQEISDPFLKKALTLAIDGSDLQEIRGMLELEIGLEEARAEEEAKVLEGAGGYAPTIGIIGAVMGLIQVMKNLANIEDVGHGIAVAFVATVYGVGLANLFLLPAAQKMKARTRAEIQRKELVLEGIAGLVEGLNPKLLRGKLEAFAKVSSENPKAGKQSDASPALGNQAAGKASVFSGNS